MNFRVRRPVVALLVVAHLAGVFSPSLRACGPWLPEQILISRQAILRTPVGDFAQEVIALTEEDGAPALPPGCVRLPWSPRLPDEGVPDSGPPMPPDEIAELRASLTARHAPLDHPEDIVSAYQTFRIDLANSTTLADTFGTTHDDARTPFDARARKLREKQPAPASDGFALPPTLAQGLPGEWADYLEGAWYFRHAELAAARAAWERLLARPPAERIYCSIRAAYMLARIQDDLTVPAAENARRYQRVLQLRAEGCRDLYNLVSESFGWEARRALDDHDLPHAARLYYLQAITGGTGHNPDMIRDSLREVAARALGGDKVDPAAMAAAALDPFLRRMCTLYVACRRRFGEERSHLVPPLPPDSEETHSGPDSAGVEQAWLAALTQAGVDNVREAAAIAWAAYQEADFTQAGAWLEKAPATDGLASWLRAKLALREGKVDVAARCFALAVHQYPATANGLSNDLDNATNLADDGAAFRTSQFQADLGIISLARSDYTQALTALLKSGFWNDAAYVAERVLKLDELRAYVRANFPQAPPPRVPAPPLDRYGGASDRFNGWYEPQLTPLQTLQERLSPIHSAKPAAYCLRYLLARRLARAGRYTEAREFYPALLWPKFDEYVTARNDGGDSRQPKARRADALWRAAKIMRWRGMELFGADDEPDWYVYSGDFEGESYRDDRLGQPSIRASRDEPADTALLLQIPPVGSREQRRITGDQIHPELRYHYRYLAADLAWQAASLMPNQQDKTTRVLAAGGWWLLSVHEDKAADRFYQAIVRRCGQTALGRQADESRVLPSLPPEDL